MSNIWIAKMDSTSDGRVTVLVLGDPYLDGNTVRHRNLRTQVRINDEAFDRLGLSEAETRELAGLLNSAAAHIAQHDNG